MSNFFFFVWWRLLCCSREASRLHPRTTPSPCGHSSLTSLWLCFLELPFFVCLHTVLFLNDWTLCMILSLSYSSEQKHWSKAEQTMFVKCKPSLESHSHFGLFGYFLSLKSHRLTSLVARTMNYLCIRLVWCLSFSVCMCVCVSSAYLIRLCFSCWDNAVSSTVSPTMTSVLTLCFLNPAPRIRRSQSDNRTVCRSVTCPTALLKPSVRLSRDQQSKLRLHVIRFVSLQWMNPEIKSSDAAVLPANNLWAIRAPVSDD